MRAFFLLLLWLFVSAGCSSLPKTPENLDKAVLSPLQQQLAKIPAWKLRGKVAVNNENESWSASVRWKQLHDEYLINLIGPLGQGSARINGNDTSISLETSDGETLYSNQPQTLLEEQLGWKIPIQALRYWVVGIPQPGEARQSLNELGQASFIRQDNWNIVYEDHKLYNNNIPSRITIEQKESSIRLMIYQWEEIAADE